MKCSYHPEHEASAFCVSCGKPVCSECSILLQDNKMHCKQCLLNGSAPLYSKSSWAWWLLPTFGGIIGGLIAFIANSSKKNRLKYVKSREYLIVGLIVTLIIAGSLSAAYFLGHDAGYSQGYHDKANNYHYNSNPW